jgi:hypothetical protein
MRCEICGQEYSKLGGLVNHVQRTHHVDYKSYYDQYIEPGVKHVCKYCGKACRFEHGGYLSTCGGDVCVRKQQRETMLSKYGASRTSIEAINRRHIRKYGSLEKYSEALSLAEREKKFHCEICGLGYRSQNKLSQHIKKEHKDLSIVDYYERYVDSSDHACPYCGKKRKFIHFKFLDTCGSEECLSKLHSDNNSMNDPENREKVSKSLKSISPERRKEIKSRIEATNLNKFGYKHDWSSPEIREKCYDTCKKRYGDRYYHNVKKMQETNLQRYGVRSYSQTVEFNTAKWHKIKYDGITFDSNYEVKFYNLLKYMDIDFEYHPKIKFPYVFEGETHYYFPDFKIGSRIIDLKNDYLLGLMQKENTIDSAKYQCMVENKVDIINGKNPLNMINYLYDRDLDIDNLVQKCIESPFPGTAKWPKEHPIWFCFVNGYKSPLEAWKDPKCLLKAVKNMVKMLDSALETGKYPNFCIRYIKGILSDDLSLILDRFTIAKIAPKVTALRKNDLLKMIYQSQIDISNGAYCPMAGFGGIIDGVRQWFQDHGLDSTGKIEAYDINQNFCDYYHWVKRDVLAQIVETDKTVIVCPPFGKNYEHWSGTPDEMSDISFEKWIYLIKEHIKAPNYIIIGPEKTNKSVKCNLFCKKIGVQLCKKNSFEYI